ncbi:tetratricopeptide repeat protein [candidate division CSSED10-310 bacterium]|uniref:Tetratricopeptide repeat protein n=1 Tax=candidate division CSSED10-310 bacterium TaxID=2855610 RepID=A0ABV6Z222_UNCC1
MHAHAQNIGFYKLLEPLGRGGMGVVYRAQHKLSGDIVALKTIRATGEMELLGIRREIRALARIRHPWIVKIVAEGVQDGLPWYAMEFLEGVTLRHYFTRSIAHQETGDGGSEEATPDTWWTRSLGKLKITAQTAVDPGLALESDDQTGSIPDRTAPTGFVSKRGDLSSVLPLVRKLCFTLAFLHGEGIVHRDLKPENIMIKQDGIPVLVDFGLMTEFSGEESRESLTVEAGGAGTVSYIAPEQIRGELVDARADLYALGCILYELLVGHPPFIGRNPAKIIRAHLENPLISPSTLRPEIGPELDELLHRLLAKNPRERVGHADVVAAILSEICGDECVVEGPRPKAYLYQSRCAGRDSALEKLRLFSRDLYRGKGGLVLIGGESGVGKTRLLMEIGRELARDHVLVLTGECSERLGRSLEAFQKPLQAIADRCRKRGLAETERLLGRRGKILAMYEPAISSLPGQDTYPDPVELPADAATLRLFSYLAETMRELTEETPVALLLDDLQWADELVLDFFEFVLRTTPFADNPLVILGTYRSEAVLSSLGKIIDTPDVDRISLDRLDEASITMMVGDKLGMSPPPGPFSRYLSAKSAGNPLFVSEYLRLAVDTGLLIRGPLGNWQLEIDVDEGTPEMEVYQKLPIPTSLQELIERRLEKLSATARATVEVATILGREIPTILLGAMTDLDDEELLDVTEKLLQHQIFEKSSVGALRFCHAQIRDISLSQVDPEQRQELHRRAAESIERIFARQLEQYQAELGMHWEQARDVERARTCYLTAARRVKDRYDYKEAERLYQSYLNLGTVETTESLTARIEHSNVLKRLGRFSAALKEYTLVSDTTDETKLRAICTRGKATILETQGDIQGARKAYQAALEMSEAYPLEQIMTLNDMAFFECELQGNNKEAERLCQRTRDLLISLYPTLHDCFETSSSEVKLQGIPREAYSGLIYALHNFGVVYFKHGDLDRALAFYRKCIGLFEQTGYRWGMWAVSINIGHVYVNLGDLDSALENYQKYLTICEEIGDRGGSGRASCYIGIAYHDRGDLERALENYQKYQAVSQEIGDRRSTGVASCNIGIVYRDRGDLDSALESLQKYLTISEETGNDYGQAEAIMELSEIYRVKGDLPRALKMNSQAIETFKEAGIEIRIGDCWCRRAECDLNSGDLTAAHDSLARANEIYIQNKGGEYSWRVPLIKVRLAIADLNTEAGKQVPEKAEQVVVQALRLVEEAHKSDRIPFKIETSFLLGVALKAQGLSEEAQASLERALALAQQHGYGLLERRIREEFTHT